MYQTEQRKYKVQLTQLSVVHQTSMCHLQNHLSWTWAKKLISQKTTLIKANKKMNLLKQKMKHHKLSSHHKTKRLIIHQKKKNQLKLSRLQSKSNQMPRSNNKNNSLYNIKSSNSKIHSNKNRQSIKHQLNNYLLFQFLFKLLMMQLLNIYHKP